MKEKIIFKIQPNYIFVYSIRIILLLLIIYFIKSFRSNESLFSIFIGFSIILFFLTGTRKLYIFEDRFEIHFNRLINYFSSIEIYKFEKLENVSYSKGFFNPLNLLVYMYGTNKQKEILIKYKDQSDDQYIAIVGTKKRTIEAIKIINEKIQISRKNKPSC
jgi:hypothetical protein